MDHSEGNGRTWKKEQMEVFVNETQRDLRDFKSQVLTAMLSYRLYVEGVRRTSENERPTPIKSSGLIKLVNPVFNLEYCL